MSFDGSRALSVEPAVRLRGVSKKYHLYESLKHRVYEALHPLKKKYHREFWALHDITFDIPKGSTVGILGVNGSGKSTLLQIVCGILQPTAGSVAIEGKVAALIELGAGFNPELTGRENAKINCTILGLDSASVRKKMPEIEAFADIGEFFDQPVKTYSSGMFMRVAFATAISVDPDILVIDEALAVGDARFQQKCFSKFHEFQQAKKTILLVSHDRFAIPRLCSHAILLDKGRLLEVGEPKAVTEAYSRLLAIGDGYGTFGRRSNESAESPAESGKQGDVAASFMERSGAMDRCPLNPTYNKNEHRYGRGGATIIDYLLVAGNENNPGVVKSDEEISLFIKISFERPVERPILGLTIKSKDGIQVFAINSVWLSQVLMSKEAGAIATYKFTVRLALNAADWFIDIAIAGSETEILDSREALIYFQTRAPHRSSGIVSLRTNLVECSSESKFGTLGVQGG